MPIVCMSLLTKGVQNVHHLHRHMPGDALSYGQLHIDICLVGNLTILQLSVPLVRQR